jgi:propanediol dehydratase small subunit
MYADSPVRPFDPETDYPVATKRPDLVRTPSGLALEQITLAALRSGELRADDVRATPDALQRQAAVARAAGRPQLAEALERAAELTAVPDELVLEIYTALRPRRADADELESFATRLEREFDASRVAAFVREAAAAYGERGLLA